MQQTLKVAATFEKIVFTQPLSPEEMPMAVGMTIKHHFTLFATDSETSSE